MPSELEFAANQTLAQIEAILEQGTKLPRRGIEIRLHKIRLVDNFYTVSVIEDLPGADLPDEKQPSDFIVVFQYNRHPKEFTIFRQGYWQNDLYAWYLATLDPTLDLETRCKKARMKRPQPKILDGNEPIRPAPFGYVPDRYQYASLKLAKPKKPKATKSK